MASSHLAWNKTRSVFHKTYYSYLFFMIPSSHWPSSHSSNKSTFFFIFISKSANLVFLPEWAKISKPLTVASPLQVLLTPNYTVKHQSVTASTLKALFGFRYAASLQVGNVGKDCVRDTLAPRKTIQRAVHFLLISFQVFGYIPRFTLLNGIRHVQQKSGQAWGTCLCF